MTISALPTPPSRLDPTNFRDRADAFLLALPTFQTEANALAVDADADAASAAASQSAAAASQSAAQASAAFSAATAGVTQWISGTAYAEGVVVWSLVNHQSYRCTSATSGTTDPSGDGAHWTRIGVEAEWAVKSAAYTALAGDRLLADTSSAAWTLTLPASAALGDQISIADHAGTFGGANLTVARNGLNIMGLAEDMTVSTPHAAFTLVYSGATYGWRLR